MREILFRGQTRKLRPIDADELKKSMDCDGAVKYGNDGVEQTERSYSTLMRYEIADYIDDAPTLEMEPVRHGRWMEIPNEYVSVAGEKGSYYGHVTSCSICHEVNPNAFKTNYCPCCGAKMDVERRKE